jgi:hypothetical protein
MSRLCFAVTALFVLAVAGVSSAATPDQTGTFVGTLKSKVTAGSGVTSVKSELKVEIAADDLTTVTLDGAVQLSGGAILGTADGLLIFADPLVGPGNSATLATVHFKGTTIKGNTTSVELNTGPPVSLIKSTAGKFKLKKQP